MTVGDSVLPRLKKSPQDSPVRANHGEDKNFFRTALKWRNSISPLVMPRVVVTVIYASLFTLLTRFMPKFTIPMTPFEYSGAVLGLILVLRVNSGLDRWWEARKLWGSIVNASRNLATTAVVYGKSEASTDERFLRWVAVWPHVMREQLRAEAKLEDADRLLGPGEAQRVRESQHGPTYVGIRLAKLLQQMRAEGLDDFAYHRAEKERASLIDSIGACERIRTTPIPLVLAITTRRFLFFFCLLLPVGLADTINWWTPLVVALAAYPLFSLDEIGAELQNPFSPRNLSHLPLQSICEKIEGNVLAIADEKHPSDPPKSLGRFA